MFLEDRVAIITGASRGIGRNIAISLAKAGAKVVVNYAGREDLAEEVVKEIREFGGEAVSFRADVACSLASQTLIDEAVSKFGKLDILVNNAGITRDTLLLRMDEEDWDEVIDTNLKGVYNCTKAAAKIMLKQRSGKIINITSVVGIMGNPGQANYAAAKAGIIGFTKAAAKEFASRRITVNAIAPGFITTDMTAAIKEEVKQQMLKQIPLQRFGTPQDVANAVLFLASPWADYITGQTLQVDGGMVMA